MFFLASPERRIHARYVLNRRLRWIAVVLLAGLLSYLPTRLMIAALQAPNPEAILTLGGGDAREVYTAEFAKNHPNLKIWVSSGMETERADRLFQASGVDLTRVHYDRQATDTITNFTTLVNVLQRNRIRHVYLITSDFHMPRASAIATIVLGHHGIRFTPVVVPSAKPKESPLRIVRDVVRSVFWIFTGYTGSEFRTQADIARLNYEIFGSNGKR